MPRKDSSWIDKSGLYGTWTFTTQTMTDVGYYKGLAYVVMHVMPDPMQVKSCTIPGDGKKHKACIEADNRACSHAGAKDNEHQICVNTETSMVEWSDVNVFFQFGFRLRTGIVKKNYHDVHTSDWVGPYNMILAPIEKHDESEEFVEGSSHNHHDIYVSRYVTTPWTEAELQRPFASSAIFNFDAGILENVVGLKAINETIKHHQKEWRGPFGTTKELSTERKTEVLRGTTVGAGPSDPYAKYSRTCAHGDLKPILPRLVVVKTTKPPKGDNPPEVSFSMRLDYSMLSLPKKDVDDLYKLWPSMKSHLGGQFPLRGPYCYEKDPNRAYAIHLGFDSTANPDTSVWKGVKGCVEPWPCWKGDAKPPSLPPSAVIPTDNHSQGSYILDPKGLEMMIVYAVGLLLVISLVLNLKLANKVKDLQQSVSRITAYHQTQATGRSDSGNSTPPRDNRSPTRSVSYSHYLREAVESRSALEEPLLTASSSEDTDRGGSANGVEESKEEAE